MSNYKPRLTEARKLEMSKASRNKLKFTNCMIRLPLRSQNNPPIWCGMLSGIGGLKQERKKTRVMTASAQTGAIGLSDFTVNRRSR